MTVGEAIIALQRMPQGAPFCFGGAEKGTVREISQIDLARGNRKGDGYAFDFGAGGDHVIAVAV